MTTTPTHNGPYTPSEFVARFGTIEPTDDPVAVDPAVVEAAEAVDAAREVYDAADRTWQSAVRQHHRKAGTGTAELVDLAKEERDRAGDRLQSANARYHQLAKADEVARLRAEVAANLEAQHARQAEREAQVHARLEDSGLMAKLRRTRKARS